MARSGKGSAVLYEHHYQPQNLQGQSTHTTAQASSMPLPSRVAGHAAANHSALHEGSASCHGCQVAFPRMVARSAAPDCTPCAPSGPFCLSAHLQLWLRQGAALPVLHCQVLMMFCAIRVTMSRAQMRKRPILVQALG